MTQLLVGVLLGALVLLNARATWVVVRDLHSLNGNLSIAA